MGPDAEVDLVKQGRFVLRWLNTDEHSNGAVMHGTITRLDAPNLLEILGDIHGVLRFDLDPEDEGTLLTFSSTLDLPKIYRARMLAGWHYHLDALDGLLSGKPLDLVDLPNDLWRRIHERYVAWSLNRRQAFVYRLFRLHATRSRTPLHTTPMA